MFDVGSPHHPLSLKIRSDLKIVEQTYRDERYWVVGDMLSLEFYRLNEQEFRLLSWIDGRRSVDELKGLFEQTFRPYQISHREIEQQLFGFYQKSLLANFASDQGRHLRRMGKRKQLQKSWKSARNLLAVRCRGVNPDATFRLLTPWCGWFFSIWMVIPNVLLMLSALIWLGVHFDEFQSHLPGMTQFFSQSNWLSLAVVLVVLKVLHEFGHGIVFTKYGGRCHELGVMLLVFLPTLYVNTSDSWRIADKWQRAAIAAAGIYVELFLATIATFAWWFSSPGPFQYACLNLMFLASVSAFLFNGNPLLKFDGYYLLSDIIEIPNLQRRSGALIRNWVMHYGLGVREGNEGQTSWSMKGWLASYAVASYLFRLFVVYTLAFMIVKLFRPAGLEEFAKMFSLLVMLVLGLGPLLGIVKYFWIPGRTHQVRRGRATLTAILLTAALLFIVAVPLPHEIACEFVVEPAEAETVYVAHHAILKEVYVVPRQNVRRGDPLALLQNLEVELEVAELRRELHEMDQQARMLQLSRFASMKDVPQSLNLREERVTVQRRLDELQKIQNAMLLVAPCDGSLVMQWEDRLPKSDSDDLQQWSGWILHKENLNARLEAGLAVCRVGLLERPVAKLIIDQGDIRFVEKGQRVRLLLDSQAFASSLSSIASVSEADSDYIDAKVVLKNGGQVEALPNLKSRDEDVRERNVARPAEATYEAFVDMPLMHEPIEAGLRGQAKILVGKSTLGSRMHRFFRKTFRFDL
jgi:putative peptide zinc metalloprotease protein